jgi:uncharacterized protein HemX
VTSDQLLTAVFGTAFIVTLAVAAGLAGAVFGWLKAQPSEAEKDRAALREQAELDACYDAGYRDGREHCELEALMPDPDAGLDS